jgi:hypothetical protein
VHLFNNLTETYQPFWTFLKKRFIAIYTVNIIPSFLLFILPWYALLPILLAFPLFQLVIPSVSLGTQGWKENVKTGFKYSFSSYPISLITFLVIALLVVVFIQPIAFVGSIVENEMRGPALLPDLLDLISGFIEKITATYGLNGIFWGNVSRQIVYVLALILIVPLYSILSCFLFININEVRTAKTLKKDFQNFGKRDRLKETEVED